MDDSGNAAICGRGGQDILKGRGVPSRADLTRWQRLARVEPSDMKRRATPKALSRLQPSQGLSPFQGIPFRQMLLVRFAQ